MDNSPSDQENSILLDVLLNCIVQTMPKYRMRKNNASARENRIKRKCIDISAQGTSSIAASIDEITKKTESFLQYGIQRCPNVLEMIGNESVRKIRVCIYMLSITSRFFIYLDNTFKS